MNQDMQLKWKVNQMDCYPEFSGETDYVFNVHWDCLGYYNGISGGPFYGRTYGVTSVPSSPGPFIPYIDLKEEQVLDWVYAAMPSGGKENYEGSVVQQIVNQINPPVVTPPNPWPADVFPIIAPSIQVQPIRKDSVNVIGATGSSLEIVNIQVDQAGTYDVAISNSLGSVVSSGCNITVFPPVSPVITIQPSGGDINYYSMFAMSVSATGYPIPSYQWNLNGSPISGAINPMYWINNADVQNAGDYEVKVYSAAGEVMSNVAHVNVIVPEPAAPTILTQPVPMTPTLGSSAYFNVVGSGYPPFTYQWYKDGSALAGANESTLAINQVSISDSGIYKVVLTNTAGSTDSNEVSLSIIS